MFKVGDKVWVTNRSADPYYFPGIIQKIDETGIFHILWNNDEEIYEWNEKANLFVIGEPNDIMKELCSK